MSDSNAEEINTSCHTESTSINEFEVMLIQKIKISNFKTYLSLDLDLTVDDDRPIILIGGSNGGGKTTLFEAISGALYGLKIESKEHFMELLNQGAINKVKAGKFSLQNNFCRQGVGGSSKSIS